jgi:hypothetical protein
MRLIIAGLICVLTALTVACGGSDDKATNTPGASGSASATAAGNPTATSTTKGTPGPDSDYYTQLESYFTDSRDRSNAATTKLDDDLAAATTLDEEKTAINTFLDTMIGVFDDAVATMNDLDPPPEAASAHDSFRNDISQAKGISAGLQSDISDASTQDAAQAVVDDFNNRVATLVNDAQGACRDLQTLADGQNAGVDLQCKVAE